MKADARVYCSFVYVAPSPATLAGGAQQCTKSVLFTVVPQVWEKAGARGLFRGVTPSLVRAFLVSGSRFTAFEAAMTAITGAEDCAQRSRT